MNKAIQEVESEIRAIPDMHSSEREATLGAVQLLQSLGQAFNILGRGRYFDAGLENILVCRDDEDMKLAAIVHNEAVEFRTKVYPLCMRLQLVCKKTENVL